MISQLYLKKDLLSDNHRKLCLCGVMFVLNRWFGRKWRKFPGQISVHMTKQKVIRKNSFNFSYIEICVRPKVGGSGRALNQATSLYATPERASLQISQQITQ